MTFFTLFVCIAMPAVSSKAKIAAIIFFDSSYYGIYINVGPEVTQLSQYLCFVV